MLLGLYWRVMLNDNRKIKVLHILESFGGGGVEEWVKYISTLCDKDRFNFKIYFCGYIYDKDLFDYKDELEKAGVEVIYRGINLSGHKRKLNAAKEITDKNHYTRQLRRLAIYVSLNITAFFQLIKILRKERFDIIHIHLYRLFITGGLAGKLFKIPVVHTISGLKSQYDSYQKMVFHVYRYFNFLICTFITAASKDELIKYAKIPERKIRFIKSAADLSRVKYIDRENNSILSEFNLRDSFPVLLSVGRMDPEKGHIYSINAIKGLILKYPNIRLILLGDGSELEKLRRSVIDLGLNEYVTLPGFRNDLNKFHSLSDIYLRTSIYEGANMASILAMAYGKAVIGFNTKAETEIIADGDNGILVPPKDIEGLRKAISNLANNKELRETIGKKAKEYVYNNCDIMTAIRTYESIYDNVAGRLCLKTKI